MERIPLIPVAETAQEKDKSDSQGNHTEDQQEAHRMSDEDIAKRVENNISRDMMRLFEN